MTVSMRDPLTFRPRTYWATTGRRRRISATAEGTERPAPAEPSSEADSQGGRASAVQHWGHPRLMGGAFLPDFLPGEVEVARVCYASVTGDVTSIRARREDAKIRYRVVDEHWDQGEVYVVEPESSDRPLTLGELIGLIDTARRPSHGEKAQPGLVMPDILRNFAESDRDPEEYSRFVTVLSDVYPNLEYWYEGVVQEWIEGIHEERRREAREDARRARRLRRQARREEALIQSSPPRAPEAFPADLTVDHLTRVDLALLKKWIETLPGIQPASVSWGPRRATSQAAYVVAWLSPERYFFIDWTDGEGKRTYRAEAPFPTVGEAFAAWARLAGVDCAAANRE